jgi:hypothetical protein
VQLGDNVVAVRVDHSRITELSLGGIIRPVVLINEPEQENVWKRSETE